MSPFCNMCFKAGKSEKEYKSHWLRDRPGPDGVVVCPYLLSIECRYCHEKGHTVSRCPVLANKKKMQYNQYCVPVPLAPLPPLPPPPPLVMPVPKKEVQVAGDCWPQMASPGLSHGAQLEGGVLVECSSPGDDALLKRKRANQRPWRQQQNQRQRQEDKVEVQDGEEDTTILGKKRKIFTPKMSWADMCDSDVEDDEF